MNVTMNPSRRDLHTKAVHGEALVWLVAGCHWREHSTSGDVDEQILLELVFHLQERVGSLQLWRETIVTAGLDAIEPFERAQVLL